MYAILGLEAANLGLSMAAVGWLLSANRWIRLLSNTLVGGIFERFGPRMPFIISTILGFVTALLYGSGWGFAVFLLARAGWGVAWSGLRQGGYEAVWTGETHKKGRFMGILWGVVRLGSAISVALGGYLRDQYGYQVSVGVIAGLTALAIPIAIFTPWPQLSAKPQPSNGPNANPAEQNNQSLLDGWRTSLAIPVQRWLLVTAFTQQILSSTIVPTVAVFLEQRLGDDSMLTVSAVGIGTLTGLLLAARWTSNMLFGPLIGALSDYLGQTRTLILLTVVTMLGLVSTVLASGGWLIISLLLVFLATSGLFVTLSATSSGIATQAKRPQLFVGAYTTAADAGSALGPLIAFNLSQSIGLETVYVSLGLITLLVVFRFVSVECGFSGL